MSYTNRRARRALLAGSAISLLVTPGLASAQTTGAPAEKTPTNPTPEEASDIVVTGVRASLRSAINEKRLADNFSDVIKAEDIGELPDNSVADSLQRITGVQIVRDVGASREQISGQPVSIRGLPSLSLINGRTQLSGAVGRDVDFRTLSSEGYGELVISKSPTADRIEGGLGGTIELKTRNPLDFKEGLISLTAEGSYLHYAKSFNPSFSGVIAQSFLDNRLGFIVSGSYQKRRVRQDQFQSRDGWRVENGYTGSGFDFDRNGVADLITPSDLRLGYGGDEQERLGIDASVTFAATDRLTLRLDGNYSSFNRNFFNGVFRIAPLGAANLVAGSAVTDGAGTLLAASYNNQGIQSDGRLEVDNVKAYAFGLNADWRPTDRLSVNFDIAQSNGGTDGRQLINRYSLLTNRNVSFDYRTPSIIPDLVVGPGVNLDDRNLYRTDLTFNNINSGRNRELSSRLDLAYETDGFLTKIAAGARFARTTYRTNQFDQVNQANNTANSAVFDPATGLRRTAAFSTLDPLFRGFPVSGLFEGLAGNFPRTWLYTSYPGGGLNSAGTYGQIYNLDAAGQPGDLNQRINLRERTLAGYLRADFATDIGSVGVKGNIGVRVIKTDVSSVALRTQAGGALAFGEESNSYTDVLPSATAIFTLRDNLLLRIAAGKTMRRPDLLQLHSPLRLEFSSLTAHGRNIALKPFRADQADIALEWYFAQDGVLSATGFYKDVKNFIAITTQRDVNLGVPGFNGSTIYTVTRPVNVGTAKIKGFEINYQHAFTFLPGALRNLGIVANYTLTDAETSSGQSFPNLSRHVVNLVGYYDDGRFDFRAAYNWRSKSASVGDGSNGLQFLNIDEFVAAGGQLDLSTGFNLSDNISLKAEILNVTNQGLRYTGVTSRIREYRFDGRTFTAGVRVKF